MKQNFVWVLLALLTITINTKVNAQGNVYQRSNEYIWPSDPLVKTSLDKWQDQKFGMIIHWGLYAVPGIIESWQICSEPWVERDSASEYGEYKKWYFGLKKDFNPVKFDPDQWANAAKDAGMRYVVFTTKHHDGFSMFDTHETDFKITNGPFASNPKANVTKFVFDAFRKQNFMIGAYFSKPDWHSEYFWWPKYATPDRNPNYDIRKYSWRWNKFKKFTYNQINELMVGYGKIDILWLDGGWIRPLESVTDEVRSWGAVIPPWSQDIDMPSIAAMARKYQPGLLIVDRTVHGEFENYQTPEQTIPKEKLDFPWETCMTLGNAWGYVPNDQFKSSNKIIHSLIEVVAKGGSLLLGVGPGADGTFNETQVTRLREIGAWLKLNGEAIYNTRTTSIYRDGSIFFTQSKDATKRYALICFPENKAAPTNVEWSGNLPAKGSVIKLVSTGESIKWEIKEGKVKLLVPAAYSKKNFNVAAIAFQFTPAER